MERPFPSTSSPRLPFRVLTALVFGLVAFCSEIDAAQFTLTWADNSTNESGFRIERSSNGTSFAEVATVGADVVSYVDANLANSTQYWYRIRAYNSAGNSAYSNVANATTPPLASNNAPTILNIPNQSIYVDTTTGAIPFTVGDAETDAADLSVTVASSNTTLAPLSGIVLGGSGANRTISVAPAAGRTGTATITVRVSDGALTTSDTFVLTVDAVGTGPTITAQPQATTITPGSALALSVGVQAAGTVTYQWYLNGSAIAGATSATYTMPVAQRFDAGTYHVVVTSGTDSVTSASVVVSAGTTPTTGALVNLSTRASVQSGDGLMIPGFVVSGSGSKRLLLRMVGPGLGIFGLNGLLTNPHLVVKRSTGSGFVDVAENRSWGDGGATSTLREAFSLVGAFDLPTGSGDAALLLDVVPGVYSAMAADEQSGLTGLSLVELYDADVSPGSARVINMSTRGHLGPGNEVMIAGFVIDEGPITLLLRTVGPGLAQLGVQGVVANPRMDLTRRVNDVDEVIVSNDDWGTSGDADFTAQVTHQVSAFPLSTDSHDAAVVVTLPPGVYTALAQGSGLASGVALLEIYVVP